MMKAGYNVIFTKIREFEKFQMASLDYVVSTIRATSTKGEKSKKKLVADIVVVEGGNKGKTIVNEATVEGINYYSYLVLHNHLQTLKLLRRLFQKGVVISKSISIHVIVPEVISEDKSSLLEYFIKDPLFLSKG